MNSQRSFKNLVYPTLVLFAICFVSSLLLALTNQASAPVIAQRRIENENKSRREVFEKADHFSDQKSIRDGETEYKYYEALSQQNQLLGYVFLTAGKGYGGEVSVMSGIELEGKVSGLKLLQLNETAGLGMRADSPEFLNQYRGQDAEHGIQLVKGPASEHQIQALTGATITSRAVTSAVQKALELSQKLKGGH